MGRRIVSLWMAYNMNGLMMIGFHYQTLALWVCKLSNECWENEGSAQRNPYQITDEGESCCCIMSAQDTPCRVTQKRKAFQILITLNTFERLVRHETPDTKHNSPEPKSMGIWWMVDGIICRLCIVIVSNNVGRYGMLS